MSKKEIIVFHRPSSLKREIRSGSSERPWRMLRAFEAIGVELLVVDGDSMERKEKWLEVCRFLPEIKGVYSELSTTPLAVSDKDHLPRHPFLDIYWFRFLRQKNIPVTAFYRDIYWRFSFYSTMLNWYKRWPVELIYYVEFFLLKRYLSHFFVPSIKMSEYFPCKIEDSRISELPPGADIQDDKPKKQGATLKMFYVGGVVPPVYDLSPIFEILTKVSGVELVLCCRAEEWKEVKNSYGRVENVEIIHESGDSVSKHFKQSDVFLMYRKMHAYLELAMPIKLFQAIGFGVPVITNADCEMGKFVSNNGFGWSIRNEEELLQLVMAVRDKPSILESARKMIRENRNQHTWERRAQRVVNVIDEFWR